MDKINEIIHSQAMLYVLGGLWVVLEFILGKTSLVKAGSTLELVLNGLKKLLQLAGIGKDPPKVDPHQ